MPVADIVTDETVKWEWLKKLRAFNPKPPLYLMTTRQTREGYWAISKWIPYEEWPASVYARSRVDYITTHYTEVVIDYDMKSWEGAHIFARAAGIDAERALVKAGVPQQNIQVEKDKEGRVLSAHCLIEKKDAAAMEFAREGMVAVDVGVEPLANRVEAALETLGIPRTLCFSGGKGAHQHVFFNIDMERHAELVKKMNALGVRPEDLRRYVFETIICAANIPPELVGRGRPVDTSCNVWGDTTKGHPIRLIGGAHVSRDGTFNGFKTVIPAVPKTKPVVKRFTDVVYPKEITAWQIPKAFIESFLSGFSKRTAFLKSQHPAQVKYAGRMMNTPCIARIRNGIKTGRRNMCAWLLVLACRLDGLTEYQAMDVLEDYYERCEKNDFSFADAKNWLRWSYSKKDAYWSPRQCKMGEEMQLCLKEYCAYWDEIKRAQKEKADREKRKGPWRGYGPGGAPPHLRRYQQRRYGPRRGKNGG